MGARITKAEMMRAAEVATAGGVCIVIEAQGVVYRIAPVKDDAQPAADPFVDWKTKREARREGHR